MAIYDDISSAVQEGKRKDVSSLVQQALDEGHPAEEILNEALVPPMDEVGEKFSSGEAFVPDMLIAARAMSAGTEVLKPHLGESNTKAKAHAVIGTVKGDMHDIGKNLVRMMVESKGIEIADLGVDVPSEQFVEYVQEHPDTTIVCLSCLLTTTMPEMKSTIDAFEAAGLRDKVTIMVGGAPVTQSYADEIGADIYTDDAAEAAKRAQEVVSNAISV